MTREPPGLVFKGEGAARYALIISCSQYEDAALRKLTAPTRDSATLGQLLGDVELCGFDVSVVQDATASEVLLEIETFFNARRRSDLALLYFSGHGIKSPEGELYFGAKNTRHDRLRSTGVSATFVREVMQDSRARTQILVLDCCHSGAFAAGMVAKDAGGMQLRERFEGRGRIVLTASDAMQFAFEGEEVTGSNGGNSVFTHYLVEGLRTGAADLNHDGWVSVDELYDYVHDRVTARTSAQRPAMWAYAVQGDIVLARNPHIADAVELEPTPSRNGRDIDPRPRVNRRRWRLSAALAGLARWLRWSVAIAVILTVAVTVVVLLQRDAPPLDVKVNFQSQDAPVPAGYLIDYGEPFGPRRGADQGAGYSYGWVEPGTSTPKSLLGHARDRNRDGIDQPLDTLMHMAGWNPGEERTEPGSWEFAVPEGTYYVTVSVGDRVYNSRNTLRVEGHPAITDFEGSKEQEYEENTVEVTVNDGRLTIDSTGGENTKINYVHIVSAATGEMPRSV